MHIYIHQYEYIEHFYDIKKEKPTPNENDNKNEKLAQITLQIWNIYWKVPLTSIAFFLYVSLLLSTENQIKVTPICFSPF